MASPGVKANLPQTAVPELGPSQGAPCAYASGVNPIPRYCTKARVVCGILLLQRVYFLPPIGLLFPLGPRGPNTAKITSITPPFAFGFKRALR
jgi:hypothetical protein